MPVLGEAQKGGVVMAMKSLVEAIILQSIEDLWKPAYKRESLLFFRGGGFEICADALKISYARQLKIIKMLADTGARTKSQKIKRAHSAHSG